MIVKNNLDVQSGVLNCSKLELQKILIENGFPKFKADQIFIWLYRFGKTSFFDMSNIGKNDQNTLEKLFYIYRPRIVDTKHSADGTIKFLLELSDQNTIETVFIPDTKRNTICISSQVGCCVGCKFCNTGKAGFVRNLYTEEIVSQFLIVKDYLNLWQSDERLSNIVFMGMGEPLFNHQNVLRAIENLMTDEKEGISRRKITLSTSGVTDVLSQIIEKLQCRLAISLHAPNNEIRRKIMPINNVHKIEDIISVCKAYTKYHEYMKITFEYLLLSGINDSKKDAEGLVELLSGINGKVNLLQFNAWDGCDFEASPEKTVLQFAQVLKNKGITVSIRAKRGEDIMAACGQLSSGIAQRTVI
ncbi:MAG: 23S rRNA (adenine(2503)-C(2))-methyltransferase RlmN [Holosporales bacterium]|jgi:23S rRNA (adenine2503-C2)-methyltransferase|nr:23S rRNA (adenine(2503)-C(2))-methyltransferase RlmN [Holosporales bacterium]